MFQVKRGKQRREQHRTPEDSATRAATDADREAVVRGDERPTATDKDRERQTTDERLAGLEKEFVEHGQSEENARGLAQNLIREELTYQFLPDQLDGHQMFSVRSVQGVLHIYLNTAHPIYDWLQHIEDRMHEDVEEDDPAYQSIVAIRLLLSSWARMEDHTESEDDRVEIQETARNWGRHVRKVVRYQREQTK